MVQVTTTTANLEETTVVSVGDVQVVTDIPEEDSVKTEVSAMTTTTSEFPIDTTIPSSEKTTNTTTTTTTTTPPTTTTTTTTTATTTTTTTTPTTTTTTTPT